MTSGIFATRGTALVNAAFFDTESDPNEVAKWVSGVAHDFGHFVHVIITESGRVAFSCDDQEQTVVTFMAIKPGTWILISEDGIKVMDNEKFRYLYESVALKK